MYNQSDICFYQRGLAYVLQCDIIEVPFEEMGTLKNLVKVWKLNKKTPLKL